MNGIEKLASSLKKKISIGDYKSEPQKDSKTVEEGKRKVTFYIPESILKRFNEVYARRILQGNKIDRSSLISEMIVHYCEGKYE